MKRWLCALVLVASCGPIAYVGQVTLKASSKVDAARAAQADKYAPYYWTRATQYLHMAREVAAHADFQGANRFGRLAAEAADKAVTEAQIVEADPSKGPIDATGRAPAKDGKSDVAPAKDKHDVAPAKDGE